MEWALGLVIGLVLGAAGFWWWSRGRESELRTSLEEHRRRQSEAEVQLAQLRTRVEALEPLGPELEAHRERLRTAEGEASGALASLNAREREAEERRADLQKVLEQADALRQDLAHARERSAELETQVTERERAIREQRELLDEARNQLKETFEALSGEALRHNNLSFLEVARELLTENQKSSEKDLDHRKREIETLLKPLQESLVGVTEQVKEIEKQRVVAYASIGKEVEGLQSETRKLVKALGKSGHRGRWGELQLDRLFESTGLLEGEHYRRQEHVDTEEGRKRPDFVIFAPSGRTIIVDAKAPMDAYLEAVETEDELRREALLKDHARQVRDKIRQLKDKNYAKEFRDSLDLVVMFLPLESLFSEACRQDSELLQFGIDSNVFVASPTTFVMLLRSVAYTWRQDSLAKDAKQIEAAGKELYERLTIVADHISNVGKHLDNAVGSYDKMVGSLERNLLPSARRMHTLASLNLPEPPEMKPIAKRTRKLNAPELLALPFDENGASGGEEDLTASPMSPDNRTVQ